MNKQEFIDRLRSALNGRVSPSLVTENINYYEDYINMEVRKGKSEEEVLQLLGDPRLIARTIIDTNAKDESEEGSGKSAYSNGNYQDTNPKVKGYQMPGWLVAVIVIVILVLIFSVIFSVLSFLAPIIIPIMVVLFLVKLFRDWLN